MIVKYLTCLILLATSFAGGCGVVVINGETYHGTSISVTDKTVIVDGEVISTEGFPEVNIEVTGNIETLKVPSCNECVINGDINTLSTVSGDVDANGITGDVSTVSGDVVASEIGGNVKTISGNVN